jgi:hypothetical protein
VDGGVDHGLADGRASITVDLRFDHAGLLVALCIVRGADR